jgi:ubiquinone/menaquinone biosynthesis C-methylase UbiE
MLRKAKARPTTATQIDGVVADASSLPFRTGSLDVVYMVTVFGEVPRQDEMLAEIRRVLVRGGVLSISEHLPDPDFTVFSRVRRLVEGRGFELHRREGPPWSYTINFKKTLRDSTPTVATT